MSEPDTIMARQLKPEEAIVFTSAFGPAALPENSDLETVLRALLEWQLQDGLTAPGSGTPGTAAPVIRTE